MSEDTGPSTIRVHPDYPDTVLDSADYTCDSCDADSVGHDCPEYVCRECGEDYDGYGDGWDGMCGNCADRADPAPA